MKKLRFPIAFSLALLAFAFLPSCNRAFNVLPVTPPPPTSTNILSAFATIGSTSYLGYPWGIQYSNGHLWVTNSVNLQEWLVTGAVPVTTVWTYNSGVSFIGLYGDGVDPATGNVYVCDQVNNQIVVFNLAGNYLAEFGNAQLGPGFAYPTGVAVNSAGTKVYVLGWSNKTIYAYTIGGSGLSPIYTYQSSFGNTGSGPDTLGSFPRNLRVDGSGNVWVADTANHRIGEYSGAGAYLNSFKVSGLDVSFSPMDVLVDSSGNVYGVDSNASVVVKFNPSGLVLGQFGAGVLNNPQGIATDGSGNFFVTNNNPQQIVEFH
jgi:DNA-binding beta-propeller fold protein YncE